MVRDDFRSRVFQFNTVFATAIPATNASIAEIADPTAYTVAASTRPSSISCQKSNAYVENVVYPPKKPTIANGANWDGSRPFFTNTMNAIPIKNEPATFAANVP